jgi:hypothetical protein
MAFHYTIGDKISVIRREGLKPATAFIDPGERPVVWFTLAPVWEQTANKIKETSQGLLPASMLETEILGGGLFRIVVDDENMIRWDAWKKLSGVSSRTAKRLEQSAIVAGSRVEDWRVSFEPILPAQFIRIEKYQKAIWCEE